VSIASEYAEPQRFSHSPRRPDSVRSTQGSFCTQPGEVAAASGITEFHSQNSEGE